MKSWTEEEVDLLKENYQQLNNEELQRLFPDRTLGAIYHQARKLGFHKSPEVKFANRSKANKGEKCNWWKGGISKTAKGYITINKPDHPRADSRGYVMQHIVVFEEATGIAVPENCCVHHLNMNKSDNRIENLCLMLTSAHTSFHNQLRPMSADTKKKISEKAKERYKDKTKHPFYKDVDMSLIISDIASGLTVTEACIKHNISKSTYYKRIKENNHE